jgi:hypothetical protein
MNNILNNTLYTNTTFFTLVCPEISSRTSKHIRKNSKSVVVANSDERDDT